MSLGDRSDMKSTALKHLQLDKVRGAAYDRNPGIEEKRVVFEYAFVLRFAPL